MAKLYNNGKFINTRGTTKEYVYLGFMLLLSVLAIFWLTRMFTWSYGECSPEEKNTFFATITVFLTMTAICMLLVRLYFIGAIKANAVKVTPDQFPEVYAIVKKHAELLGLKRVPNLYILNARVFLRAFISRFSLKNYIIIYSYVFERAYTDDKKALEFIIGRELAKIKRNHVGLINLLTRFLAQAVPMLEKAYLRACEMSCDRIGAQLAPEGAIKGLMMMEVGEKFITQVGKANYLQVSQKDLGIATWLYVIFSRRPLLSKRVNAVNTFLSTIASGDMRCAD